MRVAIIGQGGQLARALLREAVVHGVDIQSYGRKECDLSSPVKTLESFIDGLDVDAVIIAAAYTAVDAAEDDYNLALAVNAHAPSAIATACARRNIALVHISTDYVFQGKATTPYLIDAPTDPINAYGRTKLLGEAAVLQSHSRSAIVRTSWVFDGTGKNFMTTMLRLGQTRDSLSVVSDQIGRPTYAGHLASASFNIAKALCKKQHDTITGLYHVTNSGSQISWADFASAIFERAKNKLPDPVTVTRIPTIQYPTPAKRPAYSVLNLSRYEAQFGALPDWNEGLEQAYAEWLETVNNY